MNGSDCPGSTRSTRTCNTDTCTGIHFFVQDINFKQQIIVIGEHAVNIRVQFFPTSSNCILSIEKNTNAH